MRRVPLLLLPSMLAGCIVHSRQSALSPGGPQGHQLELLFWTFTGIGTAVWLAVVGFLLVGLLRRRRLARTDASPDPLPHPEGEQRLRHAVIGSLVAAVILLMGLIVADVVVGQRVNTPPGDGALTVRVTGHQWWWEVQYPGERPDQSVTTANEIHVPIGRPVRFEIASTDVIHSFWFANLQGKKDLVPGYPTVTWFTATRAGTYIGQCAEFCGIQHAQMRLHLTAESDASFERWLAAQAQPARSPQTDSEAYGRDVFRAAACATCHRIAGTDAGGTVGPDLTHVGSRPLLAGATLPNTRGHLAGWILDPQRQKPGVRMPRNVFTPADLQALLDYLQSLK
ncbi:MAG TPA: cytochrome c oxidase subunit II [Rhodothermales bacterium]